MGQLSRAVDALTRPLRRRIYLMVARAVVTGINDAGMLQVVQLSLLDGEVRDGVERFQEYAFTSRPHDGAEAVVVFVGGNRDHGLAVAVDDRRYRPTDLAAGEAAMYTDEDSENQDFRIHLKRGKEIHLVAGASSLVLKPDCIEARTPHWKHIAV